MKKNCPVTFESLRKPKQLKLLLVFSAFPANVKKREIHKEKHRWYPSVSPCGFPPHTALSDLRGSRVQCNSELAREINGNR